LSNQNTPFKHIQAMISITITTEIAVEIQESIAQFESLIAREMSISEDLRYTHKIELYKSKIQELNQGLANGFI
jgi:hypothetical protein